MRAKIEKFHQQKSFSIDEFLYKNKIKEQNWGDWIGQKHNKSANKVEK